MRPPLNRIPKQGALGGAALLSIFLVLLNPAPAEAQYEAPPDPAGWALLDVTVVQSDGARQEGVTVVVRRGIIETIEAGTQVPAGLREISWDEGTLYVYPGFVDGHGDASISLPTPDRDDVEAWSPTREVQNFTPHRRASDYLDVNGAGLSGERGAGFVASAVFPGRGPMPGQPSLILHRRDARTPAELVLEPSLGMAMAFQGAQGAYPATLMAVHALIRQAFSDAEHHGDRTSAWASDPRGTTAPHRDEDLRYLQEVTAGQHRVFFRANGAEYVRRVLALSDELGFQPVIVGGEGAGELAAELAARDVPVLLTTDLDDPDDWDPESEEEADPAAARERDRLVPIYETAARFEEAGVPFALTSGGTGDDSPLAGARRYVEWGLSAEAALEALTRTPAELLGVPELARVEEGMAATFIVTDRELLEEHARVTWTFVNGLAEKAAEPRVEGEEPDPDAEVELEDVVGRWEGSLDVAGQDVPLTLEFQDEDGELVGSTHSDELPSTDLQNVQLDGASLTFTLPVAEMGGEARFDATIDGDRIRGSGSISSPQGEFPFTFEFRRVSGGQR